MITHFMNYIVMIYIIFETESLYSHLSSKFIGSLRFTILTPLWTSMTGDSGKAFTT